MYNPLERVLNVVVLGLLVIASGALLLPVARLRVSADTPARVH
jgi:hypothetical protein